MANGLQDEPVEGDAACASAVSRRNPTKLIAATGNVARAEGALSSFAGMAICGSAPISTRA
eukprot:CAMPEP_0184388918 /NCGR_PEP_ID=MMETSP0007-20130409/12046_1 /TAXON_ID=97485 /ORGANISM="Prymnesium parvum, Strain Texoma1" /LENGTH=60 /DNA_ID=CAMNT_0026738005 /DNA_START=144 /DNA_END=326 /DNA_ORIENTATION=+